MAALARCWLPFFHDVKKAGVSGSSRHRELHRRSISSVHDLSRRSRCRHPYYGERAPKLLELGLDFSLSYS